MQKFIRVSVRHFGRILLFVSLSWALSVFGLHFEVLEGVSLSPEIRRTTGWCFLRSIVMCELMQRVFYLVRVNISPEWMSSEQQ